MGKRLEIAKKFAKAIKSDNIGQIILFGSVARGEDKEYSDIDILIVSSKPDDIEPVLEKEVGNILIEENELVSAHVISEENFKNRKNYSFLSNVLEEGVKLE